MQRKKVYFAFALLAATILAVTDSEQKTSEKIESTEQHRVAEKIESTEKSKNPADGVQCKTKAGSVANSEEESPVVFSALDKIEEKGEFCMHQIEHKRMYEQ